MSNSVAIVAVGRMVQTIRDEVSLSKVLIDDLSKRRNITPAEARDQILASAAEKALVLAKGDEMKAKTALVIVQGNINRLPQCSKLLRKHDERTVKMAYEVKDDLAVADTSLRQLCAMIEMTDGDQDGEVYKLRGLLEELAMKALSKRQEWYFLNRIREGLQSGRLIEAIQDEILSDIAHICPTYDDGDDYGDESYA